MKIVIATNNPDKFIQMTKALSILGKKHTFLSLDDIGYHKPIKENGKTFEENSLLKAKQVCKETGYVTIADDSGLCVDTLKGKPGVYTNRYAGVDATRLQQLLKLLHAVQHIDDPKRTAQFVCVITCMFPDGKIIQTKGILKGKLSKKIINIENGLTHDPIFIPKNYNKTMSKLSLKEKLKINHRGQAIRKLIAILQKKEKEKCSISIA
ncbi:MAG: RdgB/HAM1 family non-canonical purine NTP pyrophosphatase [Mycoplasmataceae bacterium]|jgi:XTP/dITP diphosphohydrolase|nr:RdgB/HAM1 family non-canonical purine NTP pyrophosphatase [Mycoplasmataceae bacterium]